MHERDEHEDFALVYTLKFYLRVLLNVYIFPNTYTMSLKNLLDNAVRDSK